MVSSSKAWTIPEIVFVGQVSLDEIVQDSVQYKDVLGGSALYPAVYASKIGAKVGLVSLVGDDFPAEHLRTLGDVGINVQGIRSVPGKTTRIRLIYAGPQLRELDVQRGVSQISELWNFPPAYWRAQAFYFASVEPDVMENALKNLPSKRRPLVAFAPKEDYHSPQLDSRSRRIYTHVDVAFFNEREAYLVSGIEDPALAAQAVSKLGPKLVIVTLGARGHLAYFDGHARKFDAYKPPKVVTSVGAGDAFAGAFLACYVWGLPIELCSETASRVAAEALSVVGPQPRISLADDTIRLVKRNAQSIRHSARE